MKRIMHSVLPCILIMSASPAESQTLSVPNEFVAGEPAVAAEVNANFGEVEFHVNLNRDAINSLATLPDLTSIEYLSWFHEGSLSLPLLNSFGLVLAFSKPVQASDILDGFADENFAVELYRFESGDWLKLGGLSLEPVSDFGVDGSGRIDEYLIDTTDPAATDAFVIMPPTDYLNTGTHKVVIRGNFITDVNGRAVDGEFINARLPTGDIAQGGRFESWFSVD